ncbi:MAG: VCBS repeat-containing protein [Planctomycetes bacterium]|nr:VCBS repeat-containing protein [Planctomycetota bacterium]
MSATRLFFVAVGAMAILLSAPAATQSLLQEWRSDPIPPENSFGELLALGAVGDVDGDSAPEIAIFDAQPPPPGITYSLGRLRLFSGRNGAVIRSTIGDPSRAFLGSRVANLDDLDGDGIADYGADNPAANSSPWYYAWVALSGATGSVIRLWTDCTWLSRGPDADGDGIDDVLVCDRTWWDPLGFYPIGKAELRSGRTNALIHTFYGGPTSWDLLGPSVRVGDVDADGVEDICFAFPGDWSRYVPAFGFVVYSGRPPFNQLLRRTSYVGGNTFGMTVVGPGDVDGDGHSDIAAFDYGDRMSSGVAYSAVFSGRTGQPVLLIGPPFDNERFMVIAGPGDVDGDGYADLAGTGTGVELRSGRHGGVLLELPRSYAVDPRTGAASGWPVAAGDLNGDEVPDLLLSNFRESWLGPFRRVTAWSLQHMDVAILGNGCSASSAVPPRIGATRSPRLGADFEVHVSRCEPNRSAALFVGLSSTLFGGTPLPIDLSLFGFPRCALHVSIDAMIETTTTGPQGNGRATVVLPIPNDQALQGMRFHLQWAIVESVGVALTRALTCTIR